MKRLALYAMALVAAWTATPAAAHHSTAMFNATKTVVLHGTVKEFQWTNPHSWVQVLIPNDKGGSEEWSLELGPLVGLKRAGWKPTSIQAGDKVEVLFNPMRDGSHGGSLIRVTFPDGRVLNARGGSNNAGSPDAAGAAEIRLNVRGLPPDRAAGS